MRARGLAVAARELTRLALPRKFLARVLPGRTRLVEHRTLSGVFGKLLGNADLWHLNRRSVAWGLSVGLLMAYVPVPFQMVLAAGGAILIGCNLPIAVAAVWITNPFTMPPMFYAAYEVGRIVLGIPPQPFRFEMSLDWLLTGLSETWQPFLLGCALLGILLAVIGQAVVRLTWRLHVSNSWRARRQERMTRRRDSSG